MRSLAKRLDGGLEGHGVALAAPVRPAMHLVDVGEELGRYFGVTSGALVISTSNDHPLRPGDVVQAIGDDVVRSAGDAYRALHSLAAPAPAQVIREQAMMNVELSPPAAAGGERIERQIIRMRRKE